MYVTHGDMFVFRPDVQGRFDSSARLRVHPGRRPDDRHWRSDGPERRPLWHSEQPESHGDGRGGRPAPHEGKRDQEGRRAERLAALEERLGALEERVRRLEARLPGSLAEPPRAGAYGRHGGDSRVKVSAYAGAGAQVSVGEVRVLDGS